MFSSSFSCSSNMSAVARTSGRWVLVFGIVVGAEDALVLMGDLKGFSSQRSSIGIAGRDVGWGEVNLRVATMDGQARSAAAFLYLQGYTYFKLVLLQTRRPHISAEEAVATVCLRCYSRRWGPRSYKDEETDEKPDSTNWEACRTGRLRG